MSTENYSAGPALVANSTPATGSPGKKHAERRMVPASNLGAAGIELAAWYPYNSPDAQASARLRLVFDAACETRDIACSLLEQGVEDIDPRVLTALLKRISDLAAVGISAYGAPEALPGAWYPYNSADEQAVARLRLVFDAACETRDIACFLLEQGIEGIDPCVSTALLKRTADLAAVGISAYDAREALAGLRALGWPWSKAGGAA